MRACVCVCFFPPTFSFPFTPFLCLLTHPPTSVRGMLIKYTNIQLHITASSFRSAPPSLRVLGGVVPPQLAFLHPPTKRGWKYRHTSTTFCARPVRLQPSSHRALLNCTCFLQGSPSESVGELLLHPSGSDCGGWSEFVRRPPI